MNLYLSHAPNRDIVGGYWVPPLTTGAARSFEVPSFLEASLLCLNYITINELGSGNWTGGQVFDGEKLVANVSYNGRVWGVDGKEIKV